MNKKIIKKDDIEYEYVKIKTSKSVKIILKGENKVKITLPFSYPYEKAKEFVNSKEDWIKENLKKHYFSNIDENFTTKTKNLIITSGLTTNPLILKSDNIIQFIYPIGSNFYSKENQEQLKIALKKALYIEAKTILPVKLKNFAGKFGFKYNKIAFKTSKTRWGSCSFCNNINLNINLMLLEDKYIDYVLIHELCHTVQKNHGIHFWELMEQCLPNSKKISHEIKRQKMIV